MMLDNRYVYDLQIYLRDTPVSYVAKNVCHIGTEGGLFRIINIDGDTQWWPLAHVFNIRQLARRDHPSQVK